MTDVAYSLASRAVEAELARVQAAIAQLGVPMVAAANALERDANLAAAAATLKLLGPEHPALRKAFAILLNEAHLGRKRETTGRRRVTVHVRRLVLRDGTEVVVSEKG